MDVGTMVPDLDDDFKLGLTDIHPQVVVFAQQIGAQLPHQFGAGHGEGLVRPAGLHLKGADAPQALPQVLLRRLADGVEVLLTDHAAADGGQAEYLGHPLEGQVHVDALFLRLHIEGGLGAVDLELAHRLEAVAQNLHQRRFKLVAVEALEGHLPLVTHNHFTHGSFS